MIKPWEELIHTASIGTDKRQVDKSVMPLELVQEMEQLEALTPDKEEQFLHLSAIISNYRKGAYLPSSVSVTPIEEAPQEEKNYCTPSAIAALRAVLDDENSSLLFYWLNTCVENALIVSPEYIPVLFEKLEKDEALSDLNIIATANNRDKGVNELSGALKRRFNTVILPLPDSIDEEMNIVKRRVESLGKAMEIPAEVPALQEIKRIVTIFRELRSGQTTDGKTKVKIPTGTLSTAEAISVMNNGMAMAAYFGDGKITANDLASGIIGAVVKDPVQDTIVWREYLETVVKPRDEWKDIYRACRDLGF